jgi:hypothetical protein
MLIASMVLIGLMCSCISLQAKQMNPDERAETQVIGTVATSWISFNFLHIHPSKQALENKAISELKAEAHRQGFKGNIDIRNISVAGNFHGLTLLPFPNLYGLLADFQKVIASGDVVEYISLSGTGSGLIQRKIAEAVEKASETLVQKITRDSTIAVVSVYSTDRNTSEYIIGELEYNLVNSGQFRIVDRRRLDQIRIEQNFQMSGEVSDASAVSIGNILGANIVITGEITGTGSLQRVVFKVLDVRTAQIITMTREEI